MGLAWWEDDSRYDLTVWDVQDIESEGTIHADVKGRSVMPAIIIPIPLIARPQAQACRGLTDQQLGWLDRMRAHTALILDFLVGLCRHGPPRQCPRHMVADAEGKPGGSGHFAHHHGRARIAHRVF